MGASQHCSRVTGGHSWRYSANRVSDSVQGRSAAQSLGNTDSPDHPISAFWASPSNVGGTINKACAISPRPLCSGLCAGLSPFFLDSYSQWGSFHAGNWSSSFLSSSLCFRVLTPREHFLRLAAIFPCNSGCLSAFASHQHPVLDSSHFTGQLSRL